MKNHTLIAGLLFFVFMSCQHSSDQHGRLPSSEASYKKYQVCGKISYSESSRVALNDDNLFYNISLDCNNDQKVDSDDQQKVISIPLDQISSKSKAWLVRSKRVAVGQEKLQTALPFVCARVLTVEDPCLSVKNQMGYQPEFIKSKE